MQLGSQHRNVRTRTASAGPWGVSGQGWHWWWWWWKRQREAASRTPDKKREAKRNKNNNILIRLHSGMTRSQITRSSSISCCTIDGHAEHDDVSTTQRALAEVSARGQWWWCPQALVRDIGQMTIAAAPGRAHGT